MVLTDFDNQIRDAILEYLSERYGAEIHRFSDYCYLQSKSIYIISLTFLDTCIIAEQFEGAYNHSPTNIEYADPQLLDKLTHEVDKGYKLHDCALKIV